MITFAAEMKRLSPLCTSGSGIFLLKAEPQATGVYTLSGTKAEKYEAGFSPLLRGAFIVNGKKKIENNKRLNIRI
jgi:hypothetical protein